jgi:hypothetical protein
MCDQAEKALAYIETLETQLAGALGAIERMALPAIEFEYFERRDDDALRVGIVLH